MRISDWSSDVCSSDLESPLFHDRFELPTDLTVDKIQESFAPPETIAFWSLPRFIELMQAAGFSATPHRLQFNRLLAVPMLFAALVLLAATFSLRPPLRGRVGAIILTGMLDGFLFDFIDRKGFV